MSEKFDKLTPEQIELLRRFKNTRFWKLTIPESDDLIYLLDHELLQGQGTEWNDVIVGIQITKEGLAAVKYHKEKNRQKT